WGQHWSDTSGNEGTAADCRGAAVVRSSISKTTSSRTQHRRGDSDHHYGHCLHHNFYPHRQVHARWISLVVLDVDSCFRLFFQRFRRTGALASREEAVIDKCANATEHGPTSGPSRSQD